MREGDFGPSLTDNPTAVAAAAAAVAAVAVAEADSTAKGSTETDELFSSAEGTSEDEHDDAAGAKPSRGPFLKTEAFVAAESPAEDRMRASRVSGKSLESSTHTRARARACTQTPDLAESMQRESRGRTFVLSGLLLPLKNHCEG
jgi:hypothetical protein